MSGRPCWLTLGEAERGYPGHNYVRVYLIISALACIFGACRTYFSLSAALRASKRVFNKMLWAVSSPGTAAVARRRTFWESDESVLSRYEYIICKGRRRSPSDP